MVLSDGCIYQRLCNGADLSWGMQIALLEQGRILIDPFPKTQDELLDRLGPCSLDLHLGRTLIKQIPTLLSVDLYNKAHQAATRYEEVVLGITREKYILAPNEFILGSSLERICMPPDLMGIFDDKSRIARAGMTAALTARKIDPGFMGTITLEIKNLGPFHLELKPGMPVCAVSFHIVGGDVRFPYYRRQQSSWLGQTKALHNQGAAIAATVIIRP